VEEQFYIAWSVVVFLCPSRYLGRVILVLIAIAPLVRALMHYLGYPGYLIFRVTPARMDSLLFGALVALAIRSGWLSRGRRLALLGLQAGLAGLLILRFFLGPLSIDSAGYQFAFPSFIALSFASLVFLCLHLREKTLAHRLLTCYPFRIVAKYSYAIYLWHLVAAGIVAGRLPVIFARLQLTHGYRLAFISTAFCLSFAMAALSWLLIEAPALRLKDRYFSSVQSS
jgi:peptidoglycan/LPS O-acetylase OafA/YrhL